MALEKLSTEVRLQIYRYAGLCTGCTINLNPGHDRHWEQPQLPSMQVYCSLIKVCSYISREVVEALYSQNNFTFHTLHSGHFAILQGLRPKTVRALTNLTIHVNTTSCMKSCHKRLTTADGPYPDQRGLSNVERPELLPNFKATMSRLLSHVAPNRLTLQVIYDCKDLAIAQEVVEPLLSGAQPPLKDFGLRLSRWPDPALNALAERTALSAMHKLPPTSEPFRFLDLPSEIRHRILQFTDIAIPLREVMWNPDIGFNVLYAFDLCKKDHCYDNRIPYAHHACRYGDCFSRVDYDGEHCSRKTHEACRFRSCWRSDTRYMGCCCRGFHSAWSSSCQCWMSPKPLFSVSHAFLADVKSVFYASNRFVVTLPTTCYKIEKTTPPRVGADIFLRDVVRIDGLRSLRFLDITFPPFDYDYMRPHEPAYLSWLKTLALVKEHAVLPALTLRVCMAEFWPCNEAITRFRVTMTPEQEAVVLEAYRRILVPLKGLDGLQRLFLHLAWPAAWRDEIWPFTINDRPSDRTWEAQHVDTIGKVAALEDHLEKMIMGPDYESEAAGKREMPKTQWLKLALMTIPLAGNVWLED